MAGSDRGLGQCGNRCGGEHEPTPPSVTPMSKQEVEQWWHDIREDADVPEDPWERQTGRR